MRALWRRFVAWAADRRRAQEAAARTYREEFDQMIAQFVQSTHHQERTP